MTPDNLYQLIQEMRHKQRIFQEFMRFVDFTFDLSRYQFRASLVNSYAHFLDALDAAIDDYNGEENTNAKLVYDPENRQRKTAINNGRLEERPLSEYDPAVGYCPHELTAVFENEYRCTLCGGLFWCDGKGMYRPL